MGAESSVQRDGKSQEDASASASASASAGELQEGGSVLDSKPLQKNGQISSMTSLNGPSEDNTLAEVGQPDGVSVAQKEEAPETMDTVQDEVTPQVNGEKVDKESPDANDISAVEEKAAEEKSDDASEVGFKKIFRFVGFKFTLKKDKSEEKDPVKLLTVKDKEEEEVSGTDEPAKETEVKETKADTETSAVPPEATDEAAKEEEAVKEGETSPASQDTTVSPFRKLFTGGLFSNLRKKSSIKKTKEEEDKEAAEQSEEKGEKFATEHETKEEELETLVEETCVLKEDTPTTSGNEKSEATPEPKDTPNETTDDTKQEDQKAEAGAEEEKAPAEMTSEAELLSSQEKTKPQGSPLKKIFTGAGLKKLSTKKQKVKKDAESKPSESGEQAAEQLQSSTEVAEAPKADSGPSSPEESGEHVITAEVPPNESSENEGEVTSDGEKKKEGIIAWSSFKKLVTPKKRVKRPSESEDEAPAEKPAKSATLSSSESAALADKGAEEEGKEDKPAEEEPKTENTEKLVSSTEEPKKKMDTSVSWEALMCMGGPKKRTRKTSDSDDEETKIEEEVPEGEQEGKTEAAIVTSQNTESEGEGVSSPDPLSSPPERESTWDTLKRMVMSKNKSKSEEKPEESPDQVLSDGETPKDESSFSLRKLFPGRKKKKVEKQSSSDLGSGEEDSDTPAVVPLSEYDDQVETEEEAPAEPPAEIQINVSAADDRSPSWIPAIVEDTDDKQDQLSDIPEEADNASTPKSVEGDLTEAEDKAALLRVQRRAGRRLSTAEVKPVPQAPDAATTPVARGPTSECAVEVLQGIEAQVSEIPTQTSVTVEDVPMEAASEQIEPDLATETATTVANAILEPHAREEAMAICIGLDTKEIARAGLQEPVQITVESMAELCDPTSTEMLVTEKPPSTEEATVGEDEVFIAQIHQVDATDLEPPIENSVSIDPEIEVADESFEPEFEVVSAVSRVDVNVENTPVTEIIEPLSSNSYQTIQTAITEQTEPAIPVAAPSEENPIITETVVLVAPVDVESNQVVTFQQAFMGNASMSETVGFEPVKVQKTKGEGVAETMEATAIPTEATDISAIIEHASMKIQGVKEEVKQEVKQDSEIEAQSMVIAQAVIQDAVDKVSEVVPEHKKSPKLTALIPRPVKAVATTEKEIDIETETPVITDTPVAVDCVKPAAKLSPYLCLAMEVSDSIPIEFTESLGGEKNDEKPAKSLKKAVEVKASEETVIVEEVVEINEETVKDLEQVKEEQINEDQQPEVEEAAEEVKSQPEEVKPEEVKPEEVKPEEVKPEAPSGESKPKVVSVHMPVQLVLQTAEMMEELSFEEEAAEEFGGNILPTKRSSSPARSPSRGSKLPVLSEEPQAAAEETSEPETEKAPSVKCAQVMAQVIEVIEEAVKEIEPVSSDITPTS